MPDAADISAESRTKSDKVATQYSLAVTSDDRALPSGKLVGAVVGAVKIMRYLSNAPGPVGVTRIAKDTDLNTSTCFNILRTLTVEDLVFFDPQAKTYTISLGIMDLAKGATALSGDIFAVRPLMDIIARDHGVTLTLWQPVGDNRKVLILSALTRNAIRIQMTVGHRLPLLIGATGRCFAAFSGFSDDEIELRFRQIRWDRPIVYEEYRAQVRETARRGWSLDDGNFASGTVSVAVPILNDSGMATMAVTATMFAGQYAEARAAEIVADLHRFSRRVAGIVAGL